MRHLSRGLMSFRILIASFALLGAACSSSAFAAPPLSAGATLPYSSAPSRSTPDVTPSPSLTQRRIPEGILTFQAQAHDWKHGTLTLAAGARKAKRVSSNFGDLSPDATQVAYEVDLDEAQATIHVSTLDGTARAFVIPQVGVGYDQTPVWSPKGARIAFSDAKRLWVYDVATRKTHRLSRASGQCNDSELTWEPGGSHLAFYRDCTVGDDSGIYEVAVDGTHPVQIVRASNDTTQGPWPGAPMLRGTPAGLSWSPDGASIALEMVNGDVWLVGAKRDPLLQGAAAGLKRIVKGVSGAENDGARSVAWSPSGQELAFIRSTSVYFIDFREHRIHEVEGAVSSFPNAISWIKGS